MLTRWRMGCTLTRPPSRPRGTRACAPPPAAPPARAHRRRCAAGTANCSRSGSVGRRGAGVAAASAAPRILRCGRGRARATGCSGRRRGVPAGPGGTLSARRWRVGCLGPSWTSTRAGSIWCGPTKRRRASRGTHGRAGVSAPRERDGAVRVAPRLPAVGCAPPPRGGIGRTGCLAQQAAGRVYLHAGHVMCSGTKVSKSLGNGGCCAPSRCGRPLLPPTTRFSRYHHRGAADALHRRPVPDAVPLGAPGLPLAPGAAPTPPQRRYSKSVEFSDGLLAAVRRCRSPLLRAAL